MNTGQLRDSAGSLLWLGRCHSQGFLTPYSGAVPYWALILQLARKSTSFHCGVQACAPVSSSSTKFQCPLVARHFCLDDISLIFFFQISFIVVKSTQNALSSPLTCITLCTKHPYSGAATPAVLSRTCSLLSPGKSMLTPCIDFPGPAIPKGGFPPFVTVQLSGERVFVSSELFWYSLS